MHSPWVENHYMQFLERLLLVDFYTSGMLIASQELASL